MEKQAEITEHIKELLLEASYFSSKDALVNIRIDQAQTVDALLLLDFPKNIVISSNKNLQKLVSQTNKNIREKGSNSLCISILNYKYQKGEKSFVSPVLMVPLSNSFSKINQTFQFEIHWAESFTNPYLEREYPELAIEKWNLENYREAEKIESYDTTCYLDNFHYHRKAVYKDLENMLLSESEIHTPIDNLFFGSKAIDESFKEEKYAYFFQISPEQSKIINFAKQNNTLIQGPPGTGKSQVIGELAIQSLMSEDKVLICSEKRSALEIISDKLKHANLNSLAFIFNSQQNNRHFIQHLKNSWHYLEKRQETPKYQINTFREQLNGLDYTLTLLSIPDLLAGFSYDDFIALFGDLEQIPILPYTHQLPTVKRLLAEEEVFDSIYNAGLNKIIPSISKSYLNRKNIALVKSCFEKIIENEQALSKVFETLEKKDIIANSEIKLSNLWFLKKLVVNLRIQKIREEKGINQFVNGNKSKEFKKLYQSHLILAAKTSKVEEYISRWHELPLAQEFELLENHENLSYWKKRKLKKVILAKLKLPHFEIVHLINEIKEIFAYQRELDTLKFKLANLNLPYELALMSEINALIHANDQHVNYDFDAAILDEIEKISPFINQTIDFLKEACKLDENVDLIKFGNNLQEKYTDLLSITPFLETNQELNFHSIFKFESFTDLKAVCISNAIVDFELNYSNGQNIGSEAIAQKLKDLQFEQKLQSEQIQNQILLSFEQRFEEAHALLRTNPAKLKAKDKERRQLLKKGKAILIKEFSKKMRNKSMREMYASEAKAWIDILCPIILANPEQVSENLPLSRLFDKVIFDEASQIPLYKALPIIHRSSKMLIAGDSMQMGIQSYFQSANQDQIDLLHQATYHLPQFYLSEHFRSEHPALISFSNQYFYKGILQPFPSTHAAEKPIQFEYISNGVYEDGKNELEAQKVANDFALALSNDENVGLVTFSEKQLSLVLSKLNAESIEMLEYKENSGNAFAKAIENVQGDECDKLLISFGYGKNKEGKFDLKFGPLNRTTGVQRLNVLFSRAKKQISFYSSVRSDDFKMSTNEAVNLLKQYIKNAEEAQTAELKIEFPFDPSSYSINGQSIFLKNAAKNFESAHHLLHIANVLQNKNWRVELI